MPSHFLLSGGHFHRLWYLVQVKGQRGNALRGGTDVYRYSVVIVAEYFDLCLRHMPHEDWNVALVLNCGGSSLGVRLALIFVSLWCLRSDGYLGLTLRMNQHISTTTCSSSFSDQNLWLLLIGKKFLYHRHSRFHRIMLQHVVLG